jgi:hypothetical protein
VVSTQSTLRSVDYFFLFFFFFFVGAPRKKKVVLHRVKGTGELYGNVGDGPKKKRGGRKPKRTDRFGEKEGKAVWSGGGGSRQNS